MRPLTVILIIIAVALLGWRLFVYKPAVTTAPADGEGEVELADEPAYTPPVPEWELPPPPGKIPAEPAEIEVRHEIRAQGPQTRLHLFLTEKHGWWVDQVYVAFWYQEQDAKGEWIKYGERVEFVPKAIDFGETVEHDFVIYVTDIPAGKPKGTTDNWGVRVVRWGENRVRMPAPDPIQK